MVPQTWVIECIKMYKISDKVINFITRVMKSWKVENPKRDPRRPTHATIICYSNDATQLDTYGVHGGGLQI